MKIYALKPDTAYRFMYPEDDVYDSDDWEFKGEPLIDKLPKCFKAYFDEKPDEPIPDIAYLGMSTFAFKRDVATALADILEAAGEVLPFYVDGELWYCLNVLESADAVDEKRSTYEIDDGTVKFGLKDIVFDVDKLPAESSLFKIPNDNYTIIYCADRRDTDEDVLGNFFCAVAAHGYTGVKFEEVFDSD